MAIVVEFNTPGMTAAQYDSIITDLENKGAGSPDGRASYVAAPSLRRVVRGRRVGISGAI